MTKIVNVEPVAFEGLKKSIQKGFHSVTSSSRDLSDAASAISKQIQNITNEEKSMTSSYPMTIESFSLDHKGGTKSYHGKLIKTNDDKSLVIFRFGKTGIFGQVNIIAFDTNSKGIMAFDRKIRDKMRGGYDISARGGQKSDKIYSIEEFRSVIGRPLMSSIDADSMKYIDATADTKGMRAPEDPRLDEDGKLDVHTIAKKARDEEMAKRLAREEIHKTQEQKMKEAYASNPNWGAF